MVTFHSYVSLLAGIWYTVSYSFFEMNIGAWSFVCICMYIDTKKIYVFALSWPQQKTLILMSIAPRSVKFDSHHNVGTSVGTLWSGRRILATNSLDWQMWRRWFATCRAKPGLGRSTHETAVWYVAHAKGLAKVFFIGRLYIYIYIYIFIYIYIYIYIFIRTCRNEPACHVHLVEMFTLTQQEWSNIE